MAKVLSAPKTAADTAEIMSPRGTHSLGLTAGDSIDMLHQWAGDIYGRWDDGVPKCRLDKDLSCGSGSTYVTPVGRIFAEVGAKELLEMPPDAPAPDSMMISSLHAMCHEYEHIRQFTDQSVPAEVIMSLNGLHAAGPKYYDMTWGMSRSEIEADQVGANACWDIMRDQFGEKGEAAMVKYLNSTGHSGFMSDFTRFQQENAQTGQPPLDRAFMNRAYCGLYNSQTPVPAPGLHAAPESYVGRIMAAEGNPELKQWLTQEHSMTETSTGLTAIHMAFDERIHGAVTKQLGIRDLSVADATGCPFDISGIGPDKHFDYGVPYRTTPVNRLEQPEPVRKALETYQRVEERRVQLQQEAQLDTGYMTGRQFGR